MTATNGGGNHPRKTRMTVMGRISQVISNPSLGMAKVNEPSGQNQ